MISTTEILKKVRKIEIKSRSLSNHIFSGAYQTTFKGRGMSFSEVREYTAGDDVRAIDWNVTARLRTPYVKVFQEERELTVMLLIDISHSSFFGSFSQRKLEIMAEIAAVLSFSAQANNDKVGALLFSDKIEKFIPPAKGRSHMLRIIRDILTITPKPHRFTNIESGFKYLNNNTRKRTIAFVLSDFVSADLESGMRIAARKHDLIGIQVYDKFEIELPNAGIVHVLDSETGKSYWINTGDKSYSDRMQKTFLQNQKRVKELFLKNNAGFISIDTKADYVKSLRSFFQNRGIHR